MTIAPSRLCVRALHKRFGPTVALAGVNLDVKSGEVHALVGENGAGKSTLLKALAGVHLADSGSMEIDGMMHMPVDPSEAGAAGLAIIHQELALAPHLTIAENLFLGREPRRGWFVDRTVLREQSLKALARVGREHLDPDRLVATLPPADKQLVEIARALTQEVRVLVLDEPTSSLTQADVEPLLERLRALASTGVAVVYVSHVFEELFAVADRYTVLRDGETVATGAMQDIDHDGLVAAMVGRNVEQLYHRTACEPGAVALDLQSLSGRNLPTDATLTLRRGEVLGIAGLVGAGRTELLRCIFGLDDVVSGKVTALGYDGWCSPCERWQQGIGLLSEDRKHEGLSLTQSLADNLWLPCLSRRANRGLLSGWRLEQDAGAWLKRVGVKFRDAGQAIQELSGGNQQKVALARLLAADSDVLLLDEPTRGVDVGAKAEIYKVIDQLAHEQNKAVLVVSSYLPELLGLADRIAVVAGGDLLPARPVAELDEHTLLTQMTVGRLAEGVA
ncbi:MAG: ribose transport system ATP-binding protein [Planctomycetota bacterium]|jgi:ribose transport system ATP-binding protein